MYFWPSFTYIGTYNHRVKGFTVFNNLLRKEKGTTQFSKKKAAERQPNLTV